MFQQEPADHTKKVFHLKMFQILGFWRLITPHHHPDFDTDVLPGNRMSPAGPSNDYSVVSSAVDKSIEDIVWAVLSRFSCVGLCNPMTPLPGSSVHGGSPGENTGVACHALLQRIFPTQGSNHPCPLWFLLCRQILSH